MILCGSWNCLCLYLQSFKIFNILRWTIYGFHLNCHRCLNIKNHISECNKIFITCIMNVFCVPPMAKLVESLPHWRLILYPLQFFAGIAYLMSEKILKSYILYEKSTVCLLLIAFFGFCFLLSWKLVKKKFWSRHLLLMVCPFVNLSHFKLLKNHWANINKSWASLMINDNSCIHSNEGLHISPRVDNDIAKKKK